MEVIKKFEQVDFKEVPPALLAKAEEISRRESRSLQEVLAELMRQRTLKQFG